MYNVSVENICLFTHKSGIWITGTHSSGGIWSSTKKTDQAEEICHAIPAFHRKLYVAIEKQNPVDAKLLMTDHIVKFNDEVLLSQEG